MSEAPQVGQMSQTQMLRMMMDPDEQSMMWQKKRHKQEKIQKYKEYKLQAQI